MIGGVSSLACLGLTGDNNTVSQVLLPPTVYVCSPKMGAAGFSLLFFSARFGWDVLRTTKKKKKVND